jgi:two-component system, sensor histidine kinase ChiS
MILLRKTWRFSLLLQVFWLACLFAQPRDMRFRHISLEQGLSQTSINCIIQDSKGFLWFGTQDGLNKYDGYTFTVYRHDSQNPQSLSNNFIQSLHEDRFGYLWIGTSEGGLNKFDRETESFTHWNHEPENPYSVGGNTIQVIYEDRDGILWIGTRTGGLQQYHREEDRFTGWIHEEGNQQSLSHNYVTSIIEDRAGVMWIGTQGGGLNRFDRTTEQFTNWSHEPGNPHSISQNAVTSVLEDRAGILWIGTREGGLNKFDRQTNTFTRYVHAQGDAESISDNLIWSILEDQSGTLWIGTGRGGLNTFDREQEKFRHWEHNAGDPHSLSSNAIQTLFEDKSGVFWAGTNGGGLNKFNQNGSIFAHYSHQPWNSNSLSQNFVFSVWEDRNRDLWVGTGTAGLNRIDLDKGTVIRWDHEPGNPKSLSHNSVMAILESRDGAIWIGTNGGGLNKYDHASGTFSRWINEPDNSSSLSQDNIWSIVEDRNGTLWIGTPSNGLNEFEPQTEEFRRWGHEPENQNSLLSDDVRTLYLDSSGMVWVGYVAQGLSRINRETSEVTHWTHVPGNPQGLPPYSISVIYEDRAGTMWLGTLRGGLLKFDSETATVTTYAERDGLSNDVVYGILEDNNGCLWISTNRGLSKFNPATEEFVTYDVNDGLQSNEFNSSAYHQGRDGIMYFGGVNGLNAFYPDSIHVNQYIPPVIINRVAKYDDNIKLDISESTDIELSYRDKYMSFEFVAIDYRNPMKNRYAYILEGFDENWVQSGARRYVSYTNLDPGQYTFRVKGSSSDGVWNQQGVAVKVFITPPYWETWWFRIATALFLCATVIGVHKLRTRHINELNKELEQKVAARTSEIESTMQKLKNTQMQLVQSEKMASLGNLAAGVAHEVNNPIGVVKCAADVCRRCADKLKGIIKSSTADEDLKQNTKLWNVVDLMHKNSGLIVTASHNVSTIVQSLKDFARLDEADVQEADIHLGLDSTLTLLQSRTRGNINVLREYGDVPEISCRHDQMNQVFMKILSNAIDAIDERGTIAIITTVEKPWVIVKIQDDGRGIPQENLEKIFDPGFTTKGVGVGTGLSLSICYNIMQSHGGLIHVTSEPAKGTEVTISIPINLPSSDVTSGCVPVGS